MRKLNNFWIGTTIGIIVPIIGMYVYYLSFNLNEDFQSYIETAIRVRYIGTILKLAVLGNLIFFLLGLRLNLMKFCRGIIFSTFVYAGFIIYYSFF